MDESIKLIESELVNMRQNLIIFNKLEIRDNEQTTHRQQPPTMGLHKETFHNLRYRK